MPAEIVPPRPGKYEEGRARDVRPESRSLDPTECLGVESPSKGPSGLLELKWGGRTDVGMRRNRNEDALVTESRLFAVADGMGGHARGDVAAGLAVAGLRMLADVDFDRAQVLDAIRRADDDIAVQAASSPEGEMGTTLCGIAFPSRPDEASVLVFNVGDSRVYRRRAGMIEQVTRDHSVVQELIDTGQISLAEAETHPERHVVTRSMGSGTPLNVDWWTLDITVEDRYLLCSDGLVKELSTEQVASVLDAHSDPQAAAEHLVDEALAAGGRDNVTVVVVDVVGAPAPAASAGIEAETRPRHPDAAELPSIATRPQ